MSDFKPGAKTRVNRIRQRGSYDRETIYAIVDASPICHVGIVDKGQPIVIPTIHARRGDELLFHGAPASRLLKQMHGGQDVCVTVTHLDALVLARSAFHHSMNYRSAVLFGKGRVIVDSDDKLDALRVLVDKVMPGRWDEVRHPNDVEFKQTQVVSMSIDEASAKVRTGPPLDDEEDYALAIWAGLVPLVRRAEQPVPDPRLTESIELPASLTRFLADSGG